MPSYCRQGYVVAAAVRRCEADKLSLSRDKCRKLPATRHGLPLVISRKKTPTNVFCLCTANTRRCTNAGLLLGHRRRRWPNNKPTLAQRLLLLRTGRKMWFSNANAISHRIKIVIVYVLQSIILNKSHDNLLRKKVIEYCRHVTYLISIQRKCNMIYSRKFNLVWNKINECRILGHLIINYIKKTLGLQGVKYQVGLSGYSMYMMYIHWNKRKKKRALFTYAPQKNLTANNVDHAMVVIKSPPSSISAQH